MFSNNKDSITNELEKKQNVSARLLLAGTTTLLMLYFLVISLAPLKDRINSILYPKTPSKAAELDKLPQVELKIFYLDSETSGPLNIPSLQRPISLVWKTSGNPTSCTGQVWGPKAEGDNWAGTKDPQGGTLTIKSLEAPGPYVYSLNCSNATGDADGANVTINLGTGPKLNRPYLLDLNVYSSGRSLNLKEPINISKGQKVDISWKTLNTATPYSTCVSSGSWSNIYRKLINIKASESFVLENSKVYKYTIYCSNESGSAQNTVVINSN